MVGGMEEDLGKYSGRAGGVSPLLSASNANPSGCLSGTRGLTPPRSPRDDGRPSTSPLLENVHPLAVAPRDLLDRGVALAAVLVPLLQRLPERRPAHGEANEARHLRRRREPLPHLLVVLAATQDDA